MDKYVILKSFGILEINQKVLGHKATSDLWHVYYNGDWHSVPTADINEIN